MNQKLPEKTFIGIVLLPCSTQHEEKRSVGLIIMVSYLTNMSEIVIVVIMNSKVQGYIVTLQMIEGILWLKVL